MALIPQKDQDFVKEKFEKELVSEVKISYFTQGESPLEVPAQECQYCRETRQLLEEVTVFSPKIHLEVHDFVAEADKSKEMGIERIPATVISGEKSYGLKFYGIPAGYEFGQPLRSHNRCQPGHHQPFPGDQGGAGQADQKGAYSGLLQSHLTSLPRCRQAGAQDGNRKPPNHRRCSGGCRVSPASPEVPHPWGAQSGD